MSIAIVSISCQTSNQRRPQMKAYTDLLFSRKVTELYNLCEQEDYLQAIALCHWFMKEYEESHLDQVFLYYGISQFQLGDYEDAQRALLHIIEASDERGVELGILFHTYFNLSTIAVALQDTKKWAEYIGEAKKIAILMQSPENIQMVSDHITKWFRKKGGVFPFYIKNTS